LLRRACITFLLSISCGRAVELHIQFGALERILGDQLFTEEGRRYVKGNRATRCNFAYLESPHVESDNGRLRIRARFSGRSAWNVLGQCVGLGDDFRVVITARPAYSNGQLRLQDVTVTSDGKTGMYIRGVCAALSSSLARDFHYPLEETEYWVPLGITHFQLEGSARFFAVERARQRCLGERCQLGARGWTMV
jgi:hypothetical protein